MLVETYLVVRRCHESPVLITECNRVDGAQVIVVVLRWVRARPRVVLQDALIAHSREELTRRCWVDADNVRCRSRAEPGHASASFGVPLLDLPVVRPREEHLAADIEIDVCDCLCVAGVRPQELSLVIDVVQPDLCVRTCTQQQMSRVREEFGLRYGFARSRDFPAVYLLLRHEVLPVLHRQLSPQVNVPQILRYMHISPALVIKLL